MEIRHALAAALFLTLSVILATGCSQKPEPSQSTTAYNNDGLRLKYPKHWTFAYDDTPDIYASRAVGFQVSEFSTARVLIEQNDSPNSSDLASRFERELQLTTSEIVSDYNRTPIKIANFEGERLSWKDNFAGISNVEIIVIQITKTPSAVFTVFNFSDEDIAQEANYIEPFVKSISIQ